MCNYTILYQDKFIGYVFHCLDCNNIQAGFGCLSINFTIAGFGDFYNSIKKIVADKPTCGDPYYKCITIPTPCDGMSLLLSSEELRHLHEMLNVADTELKSQELINLFRHH